MHEMKILAENVSARSQEFMRKVNEQSANKQSADQQGGEEDQ
jgi:hypothetical protein